MQILPYSIETTHDLLTSRAGLTSIAHVMQALDLELSDPAYQLCRRSLVSKRLLWERLRVLICYFIFDSWNGLLLKLMSGRGDIPFLEKN